MPRKPKLPPEILRIERISDGREFTRPDVVDDFSGEIIKAKPDPRPARYVPTPEDHALRKDRTRTAQYKAVLVLAGMGDKVGYVAPPAKPKLAYNQRMVMLGGVERVITVTHTDRKPFPRRI